MGRPERRGVPQHVRETRDRNDDFVRTSSEQHKTKVTEYFTALLASGDVYAGEYEGWYDAGQEEYVPENKAKESDYKSPVNGKPLVRKSEKNYFFKLSAYREQLLAHFEAHPHFVQPDARRNEIINRIKEAQDIPISRTGSNGWGIPIPGDEEQTIYVWIDALFNYLTYVDTPARRHYWTDNGGATHFIAKDILWFHAAIWPALLFALQKCDGYDWVNQPKQIYTHSYWVSKAKLDTGEEAVIKMGKSTGNFLDPETLDALVETFGLDALRYFLSTQGPLGTTDSEFSEAKYVEVYNSDLANTFGNSASRVSNMIGKYFGHREPLMTSLIEWEPTVSKAEPDTKWDLVWKNHTQGFFNINLYQAGDAALDLVRAVDAYIEVTAPFKMAKDMTENGSAVQEILFNCAEALRIASVLLWPFIPDACEKFWERVGCDYAAQMKANGGKGKLDEWVKWGQLQPGTPIEKGDALFPRYQVQKK
ncbi:MAG: methionine--tRNA ligase [Planctomycetota bacterium]